MGSHITEEQRNSIIAMWRDSKSSFEISIKLDIPHRTVKRWCERAHEDQDDVTNLKGLKLYTFIELGRLFCWPAPKLAQSLQSYIPKLHSRIIEIKRSKLLKPKRAKRKKSTKGIACDRTLQRYLATYKIMENVKKVWSAGSVAIHGVSITWWEHGTESNCITEVGDNSKQVQGWLLVMADRELLNAKNTATRDLKIKFQLLSCERINSAEVIELISTAINKYFKNIKTLCLVTNDQGKPTAVPEPEELCSKIKGVNITADNPTKASASFEIPASFPNQRCLESYLAVILTSKDGTPNFRNSKWVELHTRIKEDKYIAEKLGTSWPFLARDKPDTL